VFLSSLLMQTTGDNHEEQPKELPDMGGSVG